MSESKKLTVEEILAACRKGVPGSGSASGADTKGKADEQEPSARPEIQATEGAPVPKSTGSTAGGPAAAGKAPKSMSVAEIMAAARAEKKGAPSAEPAKPAAAATATVATEKSSKSSAPTAKPTTPTKPKPAQGAGPKDTTSILAAARKAHRPGPISKEEAAKRGADLASPKMKPTLQPIPEKPAYAQPRVATPKPVEETRRGFLSVFFGSFLAVGFTCLGLFSALWGLGLARFMFPNILTEAPSKFKVGFPSDYPPDAVSEKFKAQFGVWVVNMIYEGQRQIVALKTVCTHLGCTPNWLEAERKFKCPCHGSGFYIDGINFEGPAPRPLERYAIRVADDGQLEIDKSKKYQQEMGQWSNPNSFVKV